MGFDSEISFENMIFSMIDEFKFLFFPDRWNNIFLDYSKNEILALIYLYRAKSANMTEISKYINAPLNTTTGVVNRLEKKKMIRRIRSSEDRRIVEIVITDDAQKFIDQQKSYIFCIIKEIYESTTEDERTAAISIFNKVKDILIKNSSSKQKPAKKIRKINIE